MYYDDELGASFSSKALAQEAYEEALYEAALWAAEQAEEEEEAHLEALELAEYAAMSEAEKAGYVGDLVNPAPFLKLLAEQEDDFDYSVLY